MRSSKTFGYNREISIPAATIQYGDKIVFWNKPKKISPNKAPRTHHYFIAHVALRLFCDNDPLKFFAVIASEQRDDFINYIWQKVCEQCAGKEKPDFSEKDIKIETLKVGDYPTIVVVMPEAKAIAEAIMVGIVLTSKIGDNSVNPDVGYRYFALEQGVDLNGGNRTVFCEWSNESHLNMGDGPEASVENFIEEIRKRI